MKTFRALVPFRHKFVQTLIYRVQNNRIGAGSFGVDGIVIAQWHMRQSWRVGIDYENKTQLVTKGLFKVSQESHLLIPYNALIGLFLIIPNAVTLQFCFRHT